MARGKIVCAAALLVSACGADRVGTPALDAPLRQAAADAHPYAGFWADDGHCEEGFGLLIAPAGEGLYSVSFCGPGGCFEPGTYRPNTPLVGDAGYQLTGPDVIGVSATAGRFQRYERCPDASLATSAAPRRDPAGTE